MDKLIKDEKMLLNLQPGLAVVVGYAKKKKKKKKKNLNVATLANKFC